MTRYYIKVILSGLFLLAVTVLIIMNSGHSSDNPPPSVHIFTTPYKVNLALIMTISAIAGVITWRMLKMFVRSSWGIYRARKEARKADKKLEGQVQQRLQEEKRREEAEEEDPGEE